jgi:hypothetical protein
VSLGTAVFGGMLIGTILGVCVVPAFFVVFQRLSEWRRPVAAVESADRPAVVHAEDGSATPAATPTGDGSMPPAPERAETPTEERR